VLSLVSSELGRSAAGTLNQAGTLTVLSFNRDQEREADEDALRVLAAEYGHIGGAIDLFELFAGLPASSLDGAGAAVEFTRTHPLTVRRIEAAREWAQRNAVAADGPRRPLPPALAGIRAQAIEDGNAARR
jgi:predicted Zn-dependent protease